MDYAIRFKEAVKSNDLDEISRYYEIWHEQQSKKDPNFDLNFCFASVIINALIILVNQDMKNYDIMMAFYESGKMTHRYTAETPELYSWYENMASNMVTKVEKFSLGKFR